MDALPFEARSSASQIFEHYHLLTLNALSSKFSASVIKEFYSNLAADPKGSNFQVVVRFVLIFLRPSVINCVLGFRSCPSFNYE